jgi:hypothetical protein
VRSINIREAMDAFPQSSTYNRVRSCSAPKLRSEVASLLYPSVQGPRRKDIRALSTQPGLNQPGLNQPGLNQPGLNQPGLNQPGLNQPGLNQPGLNQPGLAQSEVPMPMSYPSVGAQRRGYPPECSLQARSPGTRKPSCLGIYHIAIRLRTQ